MRLLRIVLLLFIPVVAYSGEISLEGTYQGENLYVNNPNSESGVGFCVYEVMVNGMTSTDEINSNSFEIDLAVYRFAIGDPVQVVIKYKEGCVPRVINPEVIAPRVSFKTLDIAVKDNELQWKTTDESGPLPFIVEQFRWNKWVQVGQVKGKGVPGTHQYDITVRLHSGENRFRVRQTDDQNNRKYTPEVNVTVDKPEVALTSDKVEKQLVFSRPTLYEIYDIYGRIVVKGYSDSVNVDNLSRGDYYLNFANKMSMFSKR
ncbi:hypothetical protein [Marinilabilia rubra]|uniref:Uncharacterized protein n=1 Tax=Marinilabilia rubra TaxID=2162893 RepID=A0A2U2B8K1_9BACT|nr:hypothetical protein [Marinilabilia rubra]PWD99373.1 hypothetical protein DDZ16_10195 [Marinilabilia rubra]